MVKLGSSASSLTCPYKFRIAKFRGTRLIHLGESYDYNKIDIHAVGECAFINSCLNGHIEIARWLIHLGESYDYNKIDIHAVDESAFVNSCINGHIEIAHWLIHLGESESYDKINPLLIDEYVKKLN